MQYDTLNVTDVRIFRFDDRHLGKIKAYAEVSLNAQLALRGLRIVEGENGLYVSYPADPFWRGDEFRLMFTATTKALRDHIEEAVLKAYNESLPK